MISFEHAKNFAKNGDEVYFFTISSKSIGQKYSKQYEIFREKYSDRIRFIELNQPQRIREIYDIEPGENRMRWNVESIFYNQQLYEKLTTIREKFDVIFSYYILDAVFIPRDLVAKKALYLCGHPKERDDFQGSFLSIYDQVFAISRDTEKYWRPYFLKKIMIISTGVDTERFSRKFAKKHPEKRIEILYIGRLILRKNIDKIIMAFAKIREKYNANLTIVGAGPERDNLKDLARNARGVRFVGNTDTPEIYFANADIFISPSEYGEGLQGAILEAMSAECAIVATNTEINRELLDENRGFLCEANVDDISRKLEEAIKSSKREIGKNARKFVLKNYSWARKVKQLEGELK